ncbi:uncharacterized protein LOC130944452 [Arachis stenosperma]|uniref:uncharacterized protein LOC130944452 n=1 Tax=Arachis stenosperma TaxID=217475 RepID=UPI0025ABF4E9|nr:uncharacterized protein LOC130944452 [Arachis stenosperma]
MGMLGSSTTSLCLGNHHCVELAKKLMMSNVREKTSKVLGAIGFIVWVIAEIPQIITNYREKSTEGLSVTFLITWIIGDIFNVFGCLLEPATLSTQLYTAVLYFIITVSLCLQAIYYGHIYSPMKYHKQLKIANDGKIEAPTNLEQNHSEMNNGSDADQSKEFDDYITHNALSSTIPVLIITKSSDGREICHQSPTYPSPTAESVLAQDPVEEPLLHSSAATQSDPVSKIKTTLCLVSSLTLLGAFNLLQSSDRGMVQKPSQEFVIYVGRKLFQVSGDQQAEHPVEHSSIGTLLGWAMAFIYMGGRFPQICLNMKRGHTQGVNPLMFLFALVGNSAYVASILVRSLDWSQIRPNLPWVVESGGCVLLDFFILIQFMYFNHWNSKALGSKFKDQTAA